jgi:cell division protease FtsH
VQVEKEVLKIYDHQQLQFQKGLAMPISKSKYEVLDDETQSVIALHEAGHALVYLLCFKKFPKKISIQSSDWGVGGYVHVKNHNRLMSLTLLRRDTQVKLAGMVAEELIFGENNVTNGGIADLEHASRNLMIAAMKNGFAGRKATFEHAQQGNGYALPVDEQIHSWVENELKLAKDNTLGLLKSHQIELGLLTDTLLKMKEMDTQALKQFIEKYELENKFSLENENSGLYQKQLLNFINASKKELTLSLNS